MATPDMGFLSSRLIGYEGSEHVGFEKRSELEGEQ
jgi:hypothetical protein